VRQLSFEGRRAGQGYFSRDASQLVFQSERESGNPFYQIYVLNLETGHVRRISPGIGKATCGWIHPGGGKVLLASTHLDAEARNKQKAELEARATGQQKRYSWDYDPHYDLFSADVFTGAGVGSEAGVGLQRLTDAPGYDAEASWSPDGHWIVFSSNRHAYASETRGLSEEEHSRLEKDKSHFVDIYIMDAGGGSPRRLTHSAGYDGGPFFSPDGRRIVWQRFSERGDTAEIFSMGTDGRDQRQLTHLGALSRAPFYHPSGDYIIFSSNLHGDRNFELYLASAKDRSAPVRVTHNQIFDGLPAFSPDGEALVFTRETGPNGSAQLFIAGWDDARAREALGLPSRRHSVVTPLLALPGSSTPSIEEDDLRAHVTALASETTQGRLTGSPGERISASYVARAFRSMGLEPAGENDTYFQHFSFSAGVSLGQRNHLRILGPAGHDEPADLDSEGIDTELSVDRDWRPLAFSKLGAIAPSEIIFAGYGLVAPASGEVPAFDDYANIDVEDRWVLIFRYLPEDLPQPARQHLRSYSSLRHKAMLARDRGARGILVVSGPRSKVRNQLIELRPDASHGETSIAAVSVGDALAQVLLHRSGRDLETLQSALDAGQEVPSFALEGVRLEAEIDLRQQRRQGRNVLARLPADREPPAGESPPMVVVGAHVDHLGPGDTESSLALEHEQGQLHRGADDNASGVAALLEIAQHLAYRRTRGTLDTRRDILFAAWSGEELGLLGSRHFAEELSDNEGALSEKIAAYLNMDMVGRLSEGLSLQGASSSSIWPAEIERHNVAIGLPASTCGDSYLPTDTTSFQLKGVPTLSAFTGVHGDYHTPRDVPEKLNYAGLRDIARLMAAITHSVASRQQAPDYAVTATPGHGAPRAGMRVYLGTIPDYAYHDKPGLRLSGVTAESPAEKAGLAGGDRVVEVAGREIESIYDYTYSLEALEVGEPVEIAVERGGRRVVVTVVPTSRD
jgi:Tol biopolymer transport system component